MYRKESVMPPAVNSNLNNNNLKEDVSINLNINC